MCVGVRLRAIAISSAATLLIYLNLIDLRVVYLKQQLKQ